MSSDPEPRDDGIEALPPEEVATRLAEAWLGGAWALDAMRERTARLFGATKLTPQQGELVLTYLQCSWATSAATASRRIAAAQTRLRLAKAP